MVDSVTLARPYAKAAFASAVEANALSSWSKALATLAQIVEHDAVAGMIDSPSLTAKQKSEQLRSLCDGEIDSKQANFIDVLSENARLGLIPEIYALFDAYRAAHEKTVDVHVDTAFELSAAQIEILKSSLKQTLARDVSLTSAVDKNLLGGVFIRAEDTVIDASVRGRLEKLATAITV